MIRLSAFVFLAALLPANCDFRGSAVQRAGTEIKPYFPDAQTSVENGGHTLRSLTCVNLGRKAIELLPGNLDETSLKELRGGFARAMTGINTFELGFQEYVLRLNLSSWTYDIHAASTVDGYPAQYDKACRGIFNRQVI